MTVLRLGGETVRQHHQVIKRKALIGCCSELMVLEIVQLGNSTLLKKPVNVENRPTLRCPVESEL